MEAGGPRTCGPGGEGPVHGRHDSTGQRVAGGAHAPGEHGQAGPLGEPGEPGEGVRGGWGDPCGPLRSGGTGPNPGAGRLRAQKSADAERDWLAAMPAGLEGTANRILDLSRTGGTPSPELLADLTDRLQQAFPDPVERALALLDCYGSGSGRCSGYPLHEGVPGELLGRVPLADLLAALGMSPACPKRCASACWPTHAAPGTPASRPARNGGWHPGRGRFRQGVRRSASVWVCSTDRRRKTARWGFSPCCR